MERKNFIDAMNALKQQHLKDIEMAKGSARVIPSAFRTDLMPDDVIVTDAFIKTLKIDTNDRDVRLSTLCTNLILVKKITD